MIELFNQQRVSVNLLIGRRNLKSRMNREVHVRFREEQGVKFPLLTRLVAALSFAIVYFLLFVLSQLSLL